MAQYTTSLKEQIVLLASLLECFLNVLFQCSTMFAVTAGIAMGGREGGRNLWSDLLAFPVSKMKIKRRLKERTRVETFRICIAYLLHYKTNLDILWPDL